MGRPQPAAAPPTDRSGHRVIALGKQTRQPLSRDRSVRACCYSKSDNGREGGQGWGYGGGRPAYDYRAAGGAMVIDEDESVVIDTVTEPVKRFETRRESQSGAADRSTVHGSLTLQ